MQVSLQAHFPARFLRRSERLAMGRGYKEVASKAHFYRVGHPA